MKTTTMLAVAGVGGLGVWALWKLWGSKDDEITEEEAAEFVYGQMGGSGYESGGLSYQEYADEDTDDAAAEQEASELTCQQLRRRVMQRLSQGRVKRAQKLWRRAKARGCKFAKGKFVNFKRKFEEAVAQQESSASSEGQMVSMTGSEYNPDSAGQPTDNFGVSDGRSASSLIKAKQFSRMGRPPTADRQSNGECPPGYETNILTGRCTLIVE